ncbi:MAG: type IV pilus secretin PilQ [SAR324 cluster bacterium]|uniref:Type IV pilus secretin PilQ n=1 Tax=SAR324 cluster bacterium TaxID=2024889 RepID=A0A7X9FTY0_9DELT|nr:type IV pilus secretin PilQ [SAR324 cluster bacterium]
MKLTATVRQALLAGMVYPFALASCISIFGVEIVFAAAPNKLHEQSSLSMTDPVLPTDSSEIAKAKVTSLSIEKAPRRGNSVIATLIGDGQYSFKKTAPSEYVLIVKGAGIDSDLMSTIVAPQGSGSIRSVRPVSEGQDTILRIFAQPEASLQAKGEGDRIIVSDVENFKPAAPEDMKAQLNVDNLSAVPASEGAATEPIAAAKPAVQKVAPAGEKTEVKSDLEKGAAAAKPATDDAKSEKSDMITNEDLTALLGDASKYSGRLISLDLQDTDIDNALRIIAEVSNLNIIASDDVTGKVTLRLIDVPWDQALDVILKTNGLDSVQEGNVIRIAPVEKLRQERESLKQAKQAEEELEPLQVKYMRISYAKAASIKPILDTVISERGSIAFDERTNQVIIKDITRGIRNVSELINKLDLRTPQVLLETQIVEAKRTLMRDLGSELGFSYIQSPETGNATGKNFPNSVRIGGSIDNARTTASAFPAAVSLTEGTAVSMLFDSADGTKSLDWRISALEKEGRIRVISRPAVATTNNTEANIESTEEIRVKKPDGGLSVATGQGASAAGGGSSATESITAGIKLRVTPQASPDYFVLLDIDAESSTFDFSRQVDGIPSKIKRKSTSTVLVSSGQTFAMGGIYKLTDQDAIGGVPFLKDVPVIGHLFRSMKTDNSDEELLFFITPRIVEGSFDDAAMKFSS